MNELDLLMTLREEVPFTAPSPVVQSTVMAAIKADPAGPPRSGQPNPALRREPARPGQPKPAFHGEPARSGRRRYARPAIACGLALAACAAAVFGVMLGNGSRTPGSRTIAWAGRPMMPIPASRVVSLGVARTEAELVAYATRAATLNPGRVPRPHEWIFVRDETAASSGGGGGYLFGPPNKRVVSIAWIRVDWRKYANLNASIPANTNPGRLVHGHLMISRGNGASLAGWKSISYRYLNSLPTDPARLESVILAQNKPGMPWYVRSSSAAIFNAISTLLQGQAEGVWVPPKLAAAMYRVLQQLPGVHFDRATDLAGRTGLGFYLVIDGWYKQELVIDPRTYLFMGDKDVAIAAHTMRATDGTRHVAKGHVLGWEALLESAIVKHPGQLP